MSDKSTYIVFVDLDKTLLITNSGKILVWASYKKKLLSNFYLAKAIFLSVIYKLRIINSERITGFMIRWLSGIPEALVEGLAKQVVKDQLIYLLRPSMVREIEQHRRQGAHIVLLSAALPYICYPLAKHLNLDGVICTAMELKNGIFTGKTEGEICMGKEKENRIFQYCLDGSYNRKDAYCYCDSYSDRFALASVGNPLCVAPDKRLRKLSVSRNWPVMKS